MISPVSMLGGNGNKRRPQIRTRHVKPMFPRPQVIVHNAANHVRFAVFYLSESLRARVAAE